MLNGPRPITGYDRAATPTGRSVPPSGAAADARRDDRRPSAPAPGRALVAAGPRLSHTSPVPAAGAAPYLTQLLSGRFVEAAEGERRVRRDARGVAPRASAAYRSADRLGSDLEPGFLTERSV
ncbi:hypothetical protein [Chthonobacter rhizosphaerae]|uniref:hypothetical protein n=1 Tax=Chthonobacter rhizosphaerae TaxID=2735553 RepID=UPI0015EE9110|nr:hypothetical protein [Chthonobacter rhizosphaerae]